ncbi:hypothetical protein F7734_04665 [Scytonema sp. UIC 10036]|nr:hypothetical protein [Scytonema sp. UIC 10036]
MPGEGYRTISAGTPVKFELVQSKEGWVARNVRSTSASFLQRMLCISARNQNPKQAWRIQDTMSEIS